MRRNPPGLPRCRGPGGDVSLCFVSFTAVCRLPAIRWSQSSTHLPVAQATFPSPLHLFMHSVWVRGNMKPRRGLWDERLQGVSLNRYAETWKKEKQGGRKAPTVLSAKDFLLTCVGGATDNRAGQLLGCCFGVMVWVVSAVCVFACVRVCVCFTCYECSHHSWQWSPSELSPWRTWGPRRRKREEVVSDREREED